MATAPRISRPSGTSKAALDATVRSTEQEIARQRTEIDTAIAATADAAVPTADHAAASVLGVTGAAVGPLADIESSADGQVLRRSGGAVAFGAVDLGDADAVTGVLPLANGGLAQAVLKGSTTWNPGSLVDAEITTTTVTVTGAAAGDGVLAVALSSITSSTSGLMMLSATAGTNVADVVLENRTGGVVDLASGTLTVWIIQA
ncbi:MAG: hypothetical protein WC538_22140 [Thermoanaerobaculia bacterium]|jgi:hypothetical protein